ncbi:MAG: hypothetical protein M3N43_03165 [Actinomycetota bacterium]|nr:hypothetical protein [Actinomycetota bacterium]
MATIRSAAPPSSGSSWAVHLDFNAKAWCDTRRERAAEQAPNALWTRIVAQVNEAVHPSRLRKNG